MASVFVNFIIILAGIALVLLSAEFSIRSALRLGKRFGVSDELMGMTVLSIGTSLPEILNHIVGSFQILSNPSHMNIISGLVIGGNIGSDLFQQNVVLSIVALAGILTISKKHLIKDMGGLIGAALLLQLFVLGGFLSRLESFILVAGYIAYLIVLKKYGMIEKEEVIVAPKKKHLALSNILILLAAFAVMGFSADRILHSSEELVQLLPISASFFGIILLGIASAMPELTTALVAIAKKKSEVSAGILIGSNVTNPMLALGLGGLISTYTVPNAVIFFDLPFKILTACMIFYFLRKNHIYQKPYAALMIVLFILYLAARQIFFPFDII